MAANKRKYRGDRSLGLVTCAGEPIFVNLSGYIRLDPPLPLSSFFETPRNPLWKKSDRIVNSWR